MIAGITVAAGTIGGGSSAWSLGGPAMVETSTTAAETPSSPSPNLVSAPTAASSGTGQDRETSWSATFNYIGIVTAGSVLVGLIVVLTRRRQRA